MRWMEEGCLMSGKFSLFLHWANPKGTHPPLGQVNVPPPHQMPGEMQVEEGEGNGQVFGRKGGWQGQKEGEGSRWGKLAPACRQRLAAGRRQKGHMQHTHKARVGQAHRQCLVKVSLTAQVLHRTGHGCLMGGVFAEMWKAKAFPSHSHICSACHCHCHQW